MNVLHCLSCSTLLMHSTTLSLDRCVKCFAFNSVGSFTSVSRNQWKKLPARTTIKFQVCFRFIQFSAFGTVVVYFVITLSFHLLQILMFHVFVCLYIILQKLCLTQLEILIVLIVNCSIVEDGRMYLLQFNCFVWN